MVPIGSKVIFLDLDIQRVACRRCDTIRQVDLGFADSRLSYTRAFERYVLEPEAHDDPRRGPASPRRPGTPSRTSRSGTCNRSSPAPSLKTSYMAIDEIAVGKGHRYLTVVLDLDSGAVVFVGEGKGADALEPFWKTAAPLGAKIEAVATDMSPAYIERGA